MGDELKAELEIGNVDQAIGDLKRKLSTTFDDPKIGSGFSKEFSKELGGLEKKAVSLRTDFKSIAATRLDAGSVSNLTKEIVRTSERSKQLSSDIVNIRKELSNPNRKSSIAFLTDELIAAEREANQLERKLSAVKATAATPVPAGLFSPNAKQAAFQKQNLSYQVNDVLTGLASGQNPTQILAQQSGQIAQIFDPKQVAVFAAAYAGLVPIVVAGGAAIAAAYRITGDIRAEAERRLKLEESITGAMNRQLLAQSKSLDNYKTMIKDAAEMRTFQDRLASSDIDSLKSKRALNEQLLKLNPAGENAKTYLQQNLEIDAQIDSLQKKSVKDADAAFAARFTSFQKSQAQSVGFEQKNLDAIKATNEKALALRDSAKDAMVAGLSGGNPLLKLMVDLESATSRAEKQFGKYGDTFVEQMAKMDRAAIQSQINRILFEGSKAALKSEQEADRLGLTPESSLNGNPRKLQLLGVTADYTVNQIQQQRSKAEADYYAKTYNPNNPKTFEQFQYGTNFRAGAVQQIADPNGRQIFSGIGGSNALSAAEIQIRQSMETVKALQSLSTSDTGAAGKGLIAEQIAAVLPDRETLLAQLNLGGYKAADAQELLDVKSSTEAARIDAERRKFQDSLAIDQINQKSVKDAEALIKNVGSSGLTDPQKIKELISIIGEVPESERTPTLVKAQREALRADAKNTRAESVKAAKQSELITDTMTKFNKLLQEGGVKVSLGETPMVGIEIMSSDLSATQRGLGTRASSRDVVGGDQ